MGISRDDAVGTLDEGHSAITDLADQLSDEDFTRPATIGGGEWSARDLVSHVTTWEEVALEALHQWRAGQTPTVETETFAAPHGVDEFNARTVDAKRALSSTEVREAAERVHEAVVRELREMSDDEWTARAHYPTERRRHLFELLGGILGAHQRPFGHAFAHLDDLRTYVESLT